MTVSIRELTFKQGGEPKSSTMGVNSDFFAKFWEDFRKRYPEYEQGVANPNMLPLALFSLFN
jgi:hypothetical protein